MNFKKLTATVLGGALLFGLAACGGTTTTTTAAPGTTAPGTTAAPAATTTAAPATTAAPEAKDVTMLVWSPADDVADAQGAWLKKETEAFAKANPQWNITWEFGEAGEGEARDKVLKDVDAAGDVYMYANDQINDLIAGNALARLGGEAEAYVKNTNAESVASSVTVDDKVYGIPFTTNTWFMYYDTSVFSEEDIKSLDTMLEKGKVSFPLRNSWYLASFYLANGGTMYGDGTDDAAGIDFGGEKGVQVTEYLVDLVANANFMVDADGSGLTGLKDGSVNAIFSGSWDYTGVKEALGDNFGAAQLPSVNIGGSDKQLLSFGGTKAFGVNPTSENLDVAVSLAMWLARPEAQKSHYDLRKIVPCNTDLLADPAIQEDLLVQAQNDTMANTAFLQPFVPSMGQYWPVADNFGVAIANKEVTKENAAERTEEFNKALNTSAVS